jgi:hypothetical protein
MTATDEHSSQCFSTVSITPSQATKKNVEMLKQILKITHERMISAAETVQCFYGDNHPPTFPFLQLNPVVGTQTAKVGAALAHLNHELVAFVPNFADFSVRDVHGRINFWEMELKGARVRGTTDIVIAPGDAVHDAEGLAPEVLLCFELKDPPLPGQLVDWESHKLQLKVELMAARATSTRLARSFAFSL